MSEPSTEAREAAEKLLREAQLLRLRAQFAAAEEKCRQALEYSPDDVGGLEMLADLLAEKGSPEEARDLYQRVLELQPGRSSAETSLARVVLEIGDREQDRLAAQLTLVGGSGSKGERKRRVTIAILLSALFSGVGQIYNGEMTKGIILGVGYLIAWIFGFSELLRFVLSLAQYRPAAREPVDPLGVILGFVGMFLWIYGVIDAAGSAQKGSRVDV